MAVDDGTSRKALREGADVSLHKLSLMMAFRVNIIRTASRKDADVSQQHLAKQIGSTRYMSANLESGRRAVRVDDFVAICWALKIDRERMMRRILNWERSVKCELVVAPYPSAALVLKELVMGIRLRIVQNRVGCSHDHKAGRRRTAKKQRQRYVVSLECQ